MLASYGRGLEHEHISEVTTGDTGAGRASGVGARYLSISHTERLAEAGAGAVTPVGSRRDSRDNALTETIIGLLRVTEVIRKRGPWKTPGEVEYATLE